MKWIVRLNTILIKLHFPLRWIVTMNANSNETAFSYKVPYLFAVAVFL